MPDLWGFFFLKVRWWIGITEQYNW